VRCPSATGAHGARAGTKLTFNVTFDARGREIARGIMQDRRAPAKELAACLRKLPPTRLQISPPGRNVGVRVAVAFP
jgi:hypothetical protein